MCSYVYIMIILILLPSHTFADVEFVTKPPKEVTTFPGQSVTLPCVLKNLIPKIHIVQWVQNESYGLHNISCDRKLLIQNIANFGQLSILGDDMNFTLLINIVVPDFENNNNIVKHNVECFVVDPSNKVVLRSTSEISIQNWKEDGFDSTFIVASVLFCVVIVFLIILLLFLRQKRNQCKRKSKNRTTAKFGKHDKEKLKMKNKDPKGFIYDYATIDVTEFRADYQETENEIYVDGDTFGSDETNAANKQSNKIFKDVDKNSENENKARPLNTDCEELKVMENEHVYSKVNKPDYKECKNEIYQDHVI